VRRRSFLGGLGTAGAAALLGTTRAQAASPLSPGDEAILQFLLAAEIIESDLWSQYNDLGGGSGRPLKAPVLGFSYQARGEYYSGRVALMEFFDDEGAEIIQRMLRKKLQIYYDPQDATRWYFNDNRLGGCRIRQEGMQSEASRTF
jgi:hypothetical protein